MLKDLMHAIFNEDIEEEDEDEVVEEPAKEEVKETPEPVVEQPKVIGKVEPVKEEVVQPEPVVEQPKVVEKDSTDYMNSPIFEKAIIQPKQKKATIFQGLDVDSVTREETKPQKKQKEYKYDRHKSVKVGRVA